MTVVAGYVDREGGRVHLAADSASVAGDGLVMPVAKIRKIRVGLDEHCLIGLAGFGAHGPLLQAHLKLDAAPDGAADADGWAQAVAEAVTEIGIEHLLVDGQGDDGRADFAGLLAWQDRLWQLNHHVAIPIESYHAIGSGASVAIGAMWARPTNTPPAEVPQLAVAAAIEHHVDIRGPVTYACTEASDG